MTTPRKAEASADARRGGDRARASVLVRAPQALAFATFVDDIDRWWRRGLAYRVARGSAGVLHLERGVGGRLFETLEAGGGGAERTVQTGRITVWEPPARLVFEWRGVNFEGDEKTEVEVCFEDRSLGPDDDEPRTYVTVTHSGFSALRPDHPVRHGKDDVAFVRDLGTWWGSLLSALRETLASSLAGSPERRRCCHESEYPLTLLAMAEVMVDDSAYPLVRVVYPSEVSNDDYDRLFARYGELCKRSGRIAYHIDMTRFNPVAAPATTRRHAASTFQRYRAELLRTTVCEGRLFYNPLVSGIVTAFDWLTGTKWPCQNFTSAAEIDAWIAEQRAADAKRSAGAPNRLGRVARPRRPKPKRPPDERAPETC